ncbi:MAG: hypothetical protein ABIH36_01875 [bacterium]
MASKDDEQRQRDQYTAVLENIEDKMAVLAEAIQPIAAIQKNVEEIKGQVDEMAPKVDATFEEIEARAGYWGIKKPILFGYFSQRLY